jgi:cyclopropane fatty-acyl-phospholipid synthase-like methyltransferase
MAGFDGIARSYHLLERMAFGGALQRARTAFLQSLAPCQHVLLLGDGDGRFGRELLEASSRVRVHSVDASAAMLALAAGRVQADDRPRITFEQADARHFDPGRRTYDAIVTLFFLDCFSEQDVVQIVTRVRPHLRAGGVWLFADFAIPSGMLARAHAHVAVWTLYRFFRWRTGLEARTLPPSEHILEQSGLQPVAHRTFRAGLIRSVMYR